MKWIGKINMIRMRETRILILVIVSVLLLILLAGPILDFLADDLPWTFYPGFILGAVLLGIPFTWHIMKIWNPATLAMKDSYQENDKKSKGWMWGPPLGVLTANIIAQLFGRDVSMFMGAFLLGWLYVFLGFTSIQAYRHRPK